ncbi:MAG: hypothetical protein AB7P34_08035 [Vicinamibacterales bacterium]
MERPAETEYRVLRETIASRGSLRPILVVIGLGFWAVNLTAVLVWLPYPLAAIIPLLLLLVTFEVIRPLHFGAERIGRYLQVFHEEAGQPDRTLSETPSWERVSMRWSAIPGTGGHPLFVPVFFLATIVNTLPVLLAQPRATPVELVAMGIPHAAFMVWLLNADRAMRTQRAVELEQFRQLRTQDDAEKDQGRR